VPAWLSAPIFLAGVGLLWLAAHIGSSHLLGYKLVPVTSESGSPTLAFLCALGLGLFFLSVPFLRNRIFYNSNHHEVVFRHSGLFGRSQRRIPLGSATGVAVDVGHGAHGGTFYDVWLRFSDGRREWLTRLGDAEGAEKVAKTLSQAARLPAVRA
jgi:hypothetical protein